MNRKNIKAGEMKYNKLTLSFPAGTEGVFRNSFFNKSILQLRVALVLLMIIYGLFGYLDVKMYPQFANHFLKIRFFIVIPFTFIVLLISFSKIFKSIWQFVLVVNIVIGGVGISIMTIYAPENFAYYSGLMLVIFSGYLFMKIRFFSATIGGLLNLIVFNFLVIFYTDVSNVVLLSNNFFFISANLIGMFAGYYVELHIRNNFYLNQKLDEEKDSVVELNKNLEKTVEVRTKELVDANSAAEALNANLSAIIEGTTDSIWAFDQEYKILYINKVFRDEFYRSFNVTLKPGSNLVNSLPETIREHWRVRYDRVLASEQYMIEDEVNTEVGTLFIQIGFNPIYEKGKVVGGACFGSNITYRKLAELEVLKAKERAEESDRLKSAFLANMSHEIRTPMNGILGFAELLKERNITGEKQRKYIQIIEKSGHRMLNIINDIVDISKIEAGLMEVFIKETNVNEHMRFIFSFFKLEAERKGLQLMTDESQLDGELIIQTDPEKLVAILTNLVKNSIKYSTQGIIELGYGIVNAKIEFFVKDTGVGIPLERQASVFERFIQAEADQKISQQGAGLGLAISKALVEMLGGQIWVESQVGKGSSFYFNLPYNPE